MPNPTDELAELLSKIDRRPSQDPSKKLAWKFNISSEPHQLREAVSSKMPVYPTRFNTKNRLDGSIIMVQFDPNMTNYWSFDDPPTGTRIYDAVVANRYHGTATNAIFTDGKYNDCLSFNGSNAYAQAGDASTFKWLHGANDTAGFKWTIEMWVKISSFSAVNFLLSTCPNGSSADTGIFSYISTLGAVNTLIARGVGGASVMTATSSNSVIASTGVWYHFCITYDQSLGSSNYSLYVNGTLIHNANKTGNTPSTSNASQPLTIGAQSTSDSFMNGLIDEFRIYNSVLSAVRIGQHARNYRFP